MNSENPQEGITPLAAPTPSNYTFNSPIRHDIADYTDFISNMQSEFERFGRALAGEVQIRKRDPHNPRQIMVEWVQKFSPMMTDEGIFRLKTLLQDTVASKNTFFSDSSSQQADELIRANLKMVRVFLALNREKFKLTNDDFHAVCGGAGNIIVFAIRRSINAKTLNATSGAVQTRYDFVGQDDQKKKGLFGMPLQ